ncbi:HvfB family MNIO-type RiPP peptide maturase [Thiomicrorhabdus lithotrophica]|uniref:UPF0276 protein NR989_09735 n=1 Tax=Thiomicrorhabdus lithotrophica TaxID=2949997 RepID=A0ABY8C8J7_9GAMM|nr:DUF692 domain-containing protein [Thiomicrorhabdus lithotrophica]WEJ62288.1 DUF692 domain-containing protein [Thiomicrorhabdus lithotrophica]
MSSKKYPVEGVGLGLRRSFFDEVLQTPDFAVDFMEIAPENWLHFGGKQGRQLRSLTERFPFVCHGLSLDLGGIKPLDEDYLYSLKKFFKKHDIRAYTEHLSYCGDSGHLYDLMPVPFTEEAVKYVADRIRRVEDILEQKIGIENVSFYAMPTSQMTEQEFVKAVLEEADCGLLFDVNNTYVNSINHQYDATEYMQSMPTDCMMYLHMAGHFDEADDLKIDTHGQPVKEQVWALLEQTYQHHGVIPTLLERDFNIPPLSELLEEVEQIRGYQKAWRDSHVA